MTSDKTKFAMDMNTMLAVQEIAEDTGKNPEQVLLEFFKSKTAEMLYDDSLKLWWEGPSSVCEYFKKELNLPS